jgi:hypothetical protein
MDLTQYTEPSTADRDEALDREEAAAAKAREVEHKVQALRSKRELEEQRRVDDLRDFLDQLGLTRGGRLKIHRRRGRPDRPELKGHMGDPTLEEIRAASSPEAFIAECYGGGEYECSVLDESGQCLRRTTLLVAGKSTPIDLDDGDRRGREEKIDQVEQFGRLLEIAKEQGGGSEVTVALVQAMTQSMQRPATDPTMVELLRSVREEARTAAEAQERRTSALLAMMGSAAGAMLPLVEKLLTRKPAKTMEDSLMDVFPALLTSVIETSSKANAIAMERVFDVIERTAGLGGEGDGVLDKVRQIMGVMKDAPEIIPQVASGLGSLLGRPPASRKRIARPNPRPALPAPSLDDEEDDDAMVSAQPMGPSREPPGQPAPPRQAPPGVEAALEPESLAGLQRQRTDQFVAGLILERRNRSKALGAASSLIDFFELLPGDVVEALERVEPGSRGLRAQLTAAFEAVGRYASEGILETLTKEVGVTGVPWLAEVIDYLAHAEESEDDEDDDEDEDDAGEVAEPAEAVAGDDDGEEG